MIHPVVTAPVPAQVQQTIGQLTQSLSGPMWQYYVARSYMFGVQDVIWACVTGIAALVGVFLSLYFHKQHKGATFYNGEALYGLIPSGFFLIVALVCIGSAIGRLDAPAVYAFKDLITSLPL